MTIKHIVDAHSLLWFLGNSPKLGANADAILQNPSSGLVLPAISLAEACWTIERGRVSLSLSDLLTALDNDPRIVIHPLDRRVIERSNSLTTIGEMHDRQIVATALVLADQGETVAVLTVDVSITASGLVPVIW